MKKLVLPHNEQVCQATIAKVPPKQGMGGGYVRLRRLAKRAEMALTGVVQDARGRLATVGLDWFHRGHRR